MFVRPIGRHLYLRWVNVRFTTVHGEPCSNVGDLRVAFRCRVPSVFFNMLVARLCRFPRFPFEVSVRRERERFSQVRDLLYRACRSEQVFAGAVGRGEVLGFDYRFAGSVSELHFRFPWITRFVVFFRFVVGCVFSPFLPAVKDAGSGGMLASSSGLDLRMSGSGTKYSKTSGKTRVPMGFLVSPQHTLTWDPFASHFSRSAGKILA